jgi:hypothetical protein
MIKHGEKDNVRDDGNESMVYMGSGIAAIGIGRTVRQNGKGQNLGLHLPMKTDRNLSWSATAMLY